MVLDPIGPADRIGIGLLASCRYTATGASTTCGAVLSSRAEDDTRSSSVLAKGIMRGDGDVANGRARCRVAE